MNLKKPKQIWQVPIYLPYLQPSLTNELIRNAELKIGYKLPYEYLDLLKIQNGGYIRYLFANSPHSLIAGIGPNFPSILEFEWLLEYKDYVSFELDGLIPFDGDGHWSLCFDYRVNRNEPEICYIDFECNVQEKIANTFKDYLNLLFLKTEGEYVIQTSSSLARTIQQISAIPDIIIGQPDTYAHGYPIYTGKVIDSLFWISPNKVPTGFIRPEDSRFHELKHLMETCSLRFPELSENDLLLGSHVKDVLD